MIVESFVFNKMELTERIQYILSKYGNDENVVIALDMIINHFKNIHNNDLTATELLLQNETSRIHKVQVERLENLIQVKNRTIDNAINEIEILRQYFEINYYKDKVQNKNKEIFDYTEVNNVLNKYKFE